MSQTTELLRVIDSVGRDRGIKKEVIIQAVEAAVLSAAQKKYGMTAVLEAHFNEELGDIDLYLFKRVVDSDDDMLEPDEEIKIEEARKLDPDAQIDDELGIKVETPDFGRIDAQSAKQVVFQKIRDAEREIIFNEYIHRKGEILTGIARRIERGNLVIDLGKTDALLPRQEIIPGEQFRPGDRVQAYLTDVVLSTRGPQIYLSRTSPKYLMKLFEMEVPEMREGIVEIKACAREAGFRSKIAVISSDRDVDPVGACVGMKGVRVQAVIQELKGEKIDIIPWNDHPLQFVRSALQPAEISSIRTDEATHTMEVMVEDTQLSLAIGRKGVNVRLAAHLTGWRLDIVSKTKLEKRRADALFNLQHIEGVTETLATSIYQVGYLNVRHVAEAPFEALQKIPGYEEEETAKKLKERAQHILDTSGDILAGAPETGPEGQFTAQPARDAKSLADERLKEMMQKASTEEKV